MTHNQLNYPVKHQNCKQSFGLSFISKESTMYMYKNILTTRFRWCPILPINNIYFKYTLHYDVIINAVYIFFYEYSDKRRYRESYIYSDTQDLVTNGGTFRGNLSPSTKGATTRFSVVSDASSNTTSGIASDKMTISFEENDGRFCKKIEKIDV